MEKKARSNDYGAVPRPRGDAQNQQIKRLWTLNPTPAVSKPLRDGVAYAGAVGGVCVGVGVVRQGHAVLRKDGPR